MHWTQAQVETLKRMRSDGRTVAEMARLFGCSVSQVHGKFRRTGLTKDGQRNALKIAAERATDVERAATTRRRMVTDGYALGYVLGVLRGDGTIWKDKRGGHVLRLRVRDREFADKFESCLRTVCPSDVHVATAHRIFNQPESVIRTPEKTCPMSAKMVEFYEVTCSNPGVVGFLDERRKELESLMAENSVQGALDGLFDSEGFMVKTCGYAGLRMTDHGLVRWISEKLRARGVENKVYSDKTGYCSWISVHQKDAVRQFCSLVHFSIPRKEEVRLRLLGGAA